MSDDNKEKVSFGALKSSNPNWIKLQSEATQWQKDNKDIPWPTPQAFCSICPTWAQFKVTEFSYRYSKVKETVDTALGIAAMNGELFNIVIY